MKRFFTSDMSKINFILILIAFLAFSPKTTGQEYKEIKRLVPVEKMPAGYSELYPGGFGAAIDYEAGLLAVSEIYDTVIVQGRSFPWMGAVNIYSENEGNNGKWELLKKIYPPVIDSGLVFGSDVDFSDDGQSLIIGASENNTAYIYRQNKGGENNWGLVTSLTVPGLEKYDYFGDNVIITDRFAFVSAGNETYHENNNRYVGAGAVYIFRKDEQNPDKWNFYQKKRPLVLMSTASFGHDMEIYNNLLIIGENGNNVTSNGKTVLAAGSAYIYEMNEGGNENWGLVKVLNSSDIKSIAKFGTSVLINDEYAVVSSRENYKTDNDTLFYAGAVYIFARNEGGTDNWGEIKKISPPVLQNGEVFGNSVSMHENRIVIGAFHEKMTLLNNTFYNVGAAYVFKEESAGQWKEEKRLFGSESFAQDRYGLSVETSEKYTFVSTMEGDAPSYKNVGSVYIYTNPGVTAVKEDEGMPDEYSLSQNYPNPFNPSTNIKFRLPENANVTLTVYNILGEKVTTLLNNKELPAGSHTVKFIADNLPSGIYIYKISTSNYTDGKKMLLLK